MHQSGLLSLSSESLEHDFESKKTAKSELGKALTLHPVIMPPPQKVARYYVIPSKILSVRLSVFHDFVSAS